MLDRAFDDPFYPSFRVPVFHGFSPEGETWLPKVDVFEKENRLVTRVDLPGVKKEEVKVEVEDGYLTLSGERKFEKEEKKDNVYRTEREYGSFRRAVPLPKGVARGCEGHVRGRCVGGQRAATGSRRSVGTKGRDPRACEGRKDGRVVRCRGGSLVRGRWTVGRE